MAKKLYNIDVGGAIKTVTIEDSEEQGTYQVTINGNTFDCEIREVDPAPSYVTKYIKHTSGLDELGVLIEDVGYTFGEEWGETLDFTGCDYVVINYRYGTDDHGRAAIWNGTVNCYDADSFNNHFNEADVQLSSNEQEGTSVVFNLDESDKNISIGFVDSKISTVSGYGFWAELTGYVREE